MNYVKAIIIEYIDRGEPDAIGAFISDNGAVSWKDIREVGERQDVLHWHPGRGPMEIFARPDVKVVRIYEQLPVFLVYEGKDYLDWPFPKSVLEAARLRENKRIPFNEKDESDV